jgi:hypothetical protein
MIVKEKRDALAFTSSFLNVGSILSLMRAHWKEEIVKEEASLDPSGALLFTIC